MAQICPNPIPWNKVFQRLKHYAALHNCEPQHPPVPLILAGWAYSNDVQKQARWQATVDWATHNGCVGLVNSVADSDFYFVTIPTTCSVGPGGGPMYRAWNHEAKDCPSPKSLKKCMVTLLDKWPKIAGEELASITRPVALTGKKARCLLVHADGDFEPPWGGWAYRSITESKRRTFTSFRDSINKTIHPHEVDHVDFIVK